MNKIQKRKNNGGFTLVELIVVMCIMGIIMGAVLNFLRPTAQLYNTTNKYLNQEEAVDMIADYLEDDLMYATGAIIIRSDEADINELAERERTMVGSPFLDNFDFKNCIVLDNTSIRSTGTAAAVRSGATGTISKYALKNGRYVDVTSDPSLLQGKELYRNTFALQDQSFMGEDQYRFSVTGSGDPALGRSACLTVHIEVSSLARDNETDTYKVHEVEFEADKPIEFLNSTADSRTGDFAVWDDAGYSGDDYIYIFYDRKDKITQENVRFKCQFFLMGSDGKYMDTPVYETTVVDPADLREEVQKQVESKNLEVIEADGKVYRRTGSFATIKDVHDISDVHVVDLANITGSTPGETRQLYAVYTENLIADEKVSVNFYENKSRTLLIKQVPDKEFGADISSDVPLWEGTEQDAAGTTFTVKYWANCDTDAMQSSFNHITSNMDLYKTSHTEFKVSFVKQDGTPAEWTDAAGNVVDYLRVREGGTIDATLMPNASDYKDPSDDPSGSYIWVFEGGDYDGQAINNTEEINEPTTLKVLFIPAPEQPPIDTNPTFSAGTGYYDDNNYPFLKTDFAITNNTGSDITGKIVITIKYDAKIKRFGYNPPRGEDNNVFTDVKAEIVNDYELKITATLANAAPTENYKRFEDGETMHINTNDMVFYTAPDTSKFEFTLEVIS